MKGIVQSAKCDVLKCQDVTLSGPLKISVEQMALLRLISAYPKMTQAELANTIGVSVRTIKRYMADLQDKDYIKRVNGKKYGKWEVKFR